MKRLLFVLMTLAFTAAADAQVNIAATTPAVGAIARTVGGEHVDVSVMSPPDRDAHYLDARPSVIADARGADLVVAVGAELEVGWLPAALSAANNPGVLPGTEGYFEFAAHAGELLDEDLPADRGLGDVHPAGNPHVYMDPVRMAEAARALAGRLAEFAPEHEDVFRGNAARFSEEVERRVSEWKQAVAGTPGVLAYHKDADYLLERLEVPVHGYIEPLPGIPPTADHLAKLVDDLRGKEGLIAYAVFHPDDGPRFLERELGWPVAQLYTQPPVDADAEGYLDVLGQWVQAIAETADG